MSLVLDDDDYPPYPNIDAMGYSRAAEEMLQVRERRQGILVIIIAGLVAGLAIGGLLVVYGVF